MLLRKNADITRIGKKTKCSIFKTKHSTELKTGKQMYVKNYLLSYEGENSQFLRLVFF